MLLLVNRPCKHYGITVDWGRPNRMLKTVQLYRMYSRPCVELVYAYQCSASGSAASAAAIVAAAEENASKKRKAVPVDPRKEIELIAIPEKLKVLDTDTADIIERKKKRLKSIHNKNRIRRRQMECNSRQVSWQSFQSSVAKLKKKKKKKLLRSS